MRSRELSGFERHLSLWVILCMGLGIGLGHLFPTAVLYLQQLQIGENTQINIPVAILIWFMIYPMMLKIDLSSLKNVGRKPQGLIITLIVNWLIKPFSMALLGFIFFKMFFLNWIGLPLANEYLAGVILLAAAPCTAMVFVWSYLAGGDPAYTLVQVSLNDLIILVAYVPLVQLLISRTTNLHVPFSLIFDSVLIFVVIPLSLGSLSRWIILHSKGKEWLDKIFIPFFRPLTTLSLLTMLVLIFAFQENNLIHHFVDIGLIAIPILIQVYLNAGITYGLMKWKKLSYTIAAPGALIGASNFFELAVATAIVLYGPNSGAALATLVGVLVEVPVMLSVCSICTRTQHWFE
jgi:ACR3 family arsenite transporter